VAQFLTAIDKSSIWQGAQHLEFFRKALLPTLVLLRYQLFEELGVLLASGELTAAPQQQRLFDRLLQVTMEGFRAGRQAPRK